MNMNFALSLAVAILLQVGAGKEISGVTSGEGNTTSLIANYSSSETDEDLTSDNSASSLQVPNSRPHTTNTLLPSSTSTTLSTVAETQVTRASPTGKETKKKISSRSLAGLIFGVLLLAALIGIVVIIFIRKRRKRMSIGENAEQGSDGTNAAPLPALNQKVKLQQLMSVYDGEKTNGEKTNGDKTNGDKTNGSAKSSPNGAAK